MSFPPSSFYHEHVTAPQHALPPREPLTLQVKARKRASRHLVLNLPIVWRLCLGFAVAALIAALAAGVVGILRSVSLSRQTDVYHHLLQTNTSLTSGRSFLELMSSKLHQMLEDANAPHPSHETLANDQSALANLAKLYTQTLNDYAQNDLFEQHADQLDLLNEAGEGDLAAQQRTLIASAQRTWQVYVTAQQEILQDISTGSLAEAQQFEQQQGEPTNADAQSALHSLIQLNESVASAVDDATGVEIHTQQILTLLATAFAIIAIALVGWFISDTLVRRLKNLHRVTTAVELGHVNERVQIIGNDEIADVSASVNEMLDTIMGLLQETRQQRDALTGAAEHLFSDMRIVNAGDLRVSTTVRSNDPIGMLANAFNFTVGRFHRLVLRTQASVEQLDVIFRQGNERTNAFLSLVRRQLHENQPDATFARRSQPLPRPGGSPRVELRPAPPQRNEEFERQAATFAIEMNTLMRRLNAIVQETRSNITPFHVKGAEGSRSPSRPLEGPAHSGFVQEKRER